jgi:hypothetical protein
MVISQVDTLVKRIKDLEIENAELKSYNKKFVENDHNTSIHSTGKYFDIINRGAFFLPRYIHHRFKQGIKNNEWRSRQLQTPNLKTSYANRTPTERSRPFKHGSKKI